MVSTGAALKATDCAQPRHRGEVPAPVRIDLQQQVVAFCAVTFVLACCELRAKKSGLSRLSTRDTPRLIVDANPEPRGNRLAQGHAIPGRDAEQLGGAPNQI